MLKPEEMQRIMGEMQKQQANVMLVLLVER